MSIGIQLSSRYFTYWIKILHVVFAIFVVILLILIVVTPYPSPSPVYLIQLSWYFWPET